MKNFPLRAFGSGIFLLVTLALIVGYAVSCHADDIGPALKVDVNAERHAISPYIYGMAYPDPALAKEISLPINRWGGDATTRYNWKFDSTNAGDDWFFMAQGSGVPSRDVDALITRSQGWNGKVLLTIPIIDYISSVTGTDCTYPVSIFGPQQKTNPYVHPLVNGQKTDAGNGRTADGKVLPPLTKEQILRTHIHNSPQYQGEWIMHLVEKFGAIDKGGVGVYELDNEPGGWGNTHRDVHPGELGDDELVSRSLAYAAAIKAVDPSALVLGPGDFIMHYQSDGIPGDGKNEHDGLGQGDYYLQQMALYEQQHKLRLLDYFDEHYYATAQDGQNDAITLEATRSFWDPTYKEKNWIGKWRGAINLIPSFHQWVDKYYPGTKIGISEYGYGDNHTLVGALAQADVLGIFARERLDLACCFGPPKATDAKANAFRLFLNYDGHGGKFGDTYVQSTSEDQGKLAIYGAVRGTDKALTLLVINKTTNALTSHITLAGFTPADSAKVFQFSAADLQKLQALPDQHVTPDGFSATFPARSMTLFAIPAK